MEIKTKNPRGIEEIIIENGGNGGRILTKERPQIFERMAFAKGLQPPPLELAERYNSLLDAYTIKFKELMEMNVRNATGQEEAGLQVELGGPITVNLWGLYKWWDIFVVGPFQNILPPPSARPNKIIAGGEWVHFVTFVVTNPLWIDGVNPPSATNIMAGMSYNLRLETVNLTSVVAGPSVAIPSVFPGFPVQAFLLGFIAPTPPQGHPQLLEVNVTADVTNPIKPMAAFATSLIDVDNDPGFPVGPPSGPHLHVEQPLRCLVYAK